MEVREYEIAASLRREMPEVGSTETIHFKMLPYKNLYVMGQRKFVGSLPKRIALKSNYELNYHITVGNGLMVSWNGKCFIMFLVVLSFSISRIQIIAV